MQLSSENFCYEHVGEAYPFAKRSEGKDTLIVQGGVGTEQINVPCLELR
jgi:hypothetical protein